MRKLCLILLALASHGVGGRQPQALPDRRNLHHLVREYEVQSDRVRYYSVERSDLGGNPAHPGRPEAHTEAEVSDRKASLE